MILSAQSIERRGLVVPTLPRTEVYTQVGTFSYGISPAGYDLRLDQVEGARGVPEGWMLRPGEFVLASAAEEFNMTPDVMGVVHDKSSWARRGLAVQNTVIEPGWRGFLTLELTNHAREPLLLPRGAGICQVVFHQLDEPTDRPYSGKYQDQAPGPQGAI